MDRLGTRPNEYWRVKDLKTKQIVNFRGFKTLERWFEVMEELQELLAKNDTDHAKALTALCLSMLEEVAVGGDWDLAWTVLPIQDPCSADPVHAMSVAQYHTAVSLLADWEKITGRRSKTTTPNSNGGGDRGNQRSQSSCRPRDIDRHRSARAASAETSLVRRAPLP